jgi:hypothetical protein
MKSRRLAAALLAAFCVLAGVRASALVCGMRCAECCASEGDPTALREQMPCCRSTQVAEPARPSGALEQEGAFVALASAATSLPAPLVRPVAPSLRPTGALPHVALYRQHCALLL